jgi:bis(5'-adenosyl)-triphosphatase
MNRITVANCPFCDSSIHQATFAESENFRAIYNIAPILPGHSLVIPKWHLKSLLDLSESEFCEMMVFGRNVVRVLLTAFSVQAFNWTIQEGEEAGQTIPHLHFHLIPRKPEDLPRPGDWYPLLRDSLNSQSEVMDSDSRPRLTQDEMRSIVTHLRSIAKSLMV